MSSHVPFLAVRPDDQFSSEVKKSVKKTTTTTSASPPPAIMSLDAPPPAAIAAVSRVPAPLRFPALVITSLILSGVVHSITAQYSGLQLASASKPSTTEYDIAFFLGWKVFQLAMLWWSRVHYEDVAALVLLINQPTYYLLFTYWELPLLPLAITLATDVLVFALPFALFRPLMRIAPTANAPIATDRYLLFLTSGLAACIYAVMFYVCHALNLGVFIITHFRNITTMRLAHEATIPRLMLLFALPGVAATFFVFRPTIVALGQRPRSARKAKKFNPETATFGETLAHNLGSDGWTPRVKVLAKRTAILAVGTLVNTAVRVYTTVEGTDVVGSVGYAGLWAVACAVVGLGFGGLVGGED